jgi:hypothetical protein
LLEERLEERTLLWRKRATELDDQLRGGRLPVHRRLQNNQGIVLEIFTQADIDFDLPYLPLFAVIGKVQRQNLFTISS